MAVAAEPSRPLHLPPPPSSLMALWGLISLGLHCWVCSRWTAATGPPSDQPGGPLDWLLSDKGPFHHSPEYIDFVEKNRQGFSTRYKIYRWVAAICWHHPHDKSPGRPPPARNLGGCPLKEACVHMDNAAVSPGDNGRVNKRSDELHDHGGLYF